MISVVCDVLLSASLCYYLHMVNTTILLSVSSRENTNWLWLHLKSRSSSEGFVTRLSIEPRDMSDHVNRMNDTIDGIILYTIENGSLTMYAPFLLFLIECIIDLPYFQSLFYCVTYLREYFYLYLWISEWWMFWKVITMPRNLIFIAIHFIISKRKSTDSWSPSNIVWLNLPSQYMSIVFSHREYWLAKL